jgi:NADH-quinone oxidoreductase subunit N
MLSICSLLTNLFILCAVLSILIGTFGAYYETGIKRLLAYSSILNGGFILLAMSLGTYGGVMAAVYHLVIYI